MTFPGGPDRLDDETALRKHDPGDMLRQVATSAAQVREALRVASETDLDPFTAQGRPRGLVVTGMGGSGIAGDVLGAVCGGGCPIPILTVRGHTLPGWVGPADAVIAVSCSGGTEETLAAAEDAVRRGSRLLAVGAPDSPLARLAEGAGAPFIPVRSAGQPRATLWGLSVPLMVAASTLGLLQEPDDVFEATAQQLEDISVRCRPSAESSTNPAKALALELAAGIPLVWGSSPLAAVAARRFVCQLAENAKYPGIAGELPEGAHNQVVALDGPFGRGAGVEDFFRDRVEDPGGQTRLKLMALRETEEHPQAAARAELIASLAEDRGVPTTSLRAEGSHRMERLAELIGMTDYASVYLALLYGIDPTPVATIDELKERVAAAPGATNEDWETDT